MHHHSAKHTTPQSNGRLLAMGDIHGCLCPLEALLESLRLGGEDTLVVLGDFVNRGPKTRQVLERLLQLAREIRLVAIMGNHEEEMLAARRDEMAMLRWLEMGGQATLDSYGPAASLSDIPAAHWLFLEQTLPSWECGDFFFTHACYAPEIPLADQQPHELRWQSIHEFHVRPHVSGKTAIVGHTPNLSGRIVDYGFLRCLDTGCGLGGQLTVMDVRTGEYWQCGEESPVVRWA
jgi:serine/threonine protein phosphatase 1